MPSLSKKQTLKKLKNKLSKLYYFNKRNPHRHGRVPSGLTEKQYEELRNKPDFVYERIRKTLKRISNVKKSIKNK